MSEGPFDSVERGDIRKFDREVQDLVMHLVNSHDIRWRWVGGDKQHVTLYPPDGVGRPFKISAHRPATMTVKFLREQFMKVYGLPDVDGVVPGATASEAEAGAPEAASPTVDQTPVVDPREAQAAILALASTLGVEMGGGVSEDEYLALIAEKDACEASAQSLMQDVEAKDEEIKVLRDTITDLIRQRDHLLNQLTRIAEITCEAQ